MLLGVPLDIAQFVERAQRFWAEIRMLKLSRAEPGFGWYPYESLSAVPTIAELIAPFFDELRPCIVSDAVADIGCGDGDLSFLFARLGCEVDAIDFAANNFNRMRGVESLRRMLGLRVQIYDVDLDAHPHFARECYGLALFLGTLYHLKNPYYLLETLAYKTRWCLLSTRVARFTPRTRAAMDGEPLAYLADGREIANDSTNLDLFSGWPTSARAKDTLGHSRAKVCRIRGGVQPARCR